MGTINHILSLMYKMDAKYREASHLNENSYGFSILTENREHDSDKRSIAVLKNIFYPNTPENEVPYDELQEKLKKFKTDFYHDPKVRASAVMRLEPMFCRFAFEECGFCTDDADQESLTRLLDYIKMFFAKSRTGEIDLAKQIPTDALYNWSFYDFDEKFGVMLDDAFDRETYEINNMECSANANYTIVGPLSYGQAHEYGNQSCPSSKLCYTQSEMTWNSSNYANNGKNNAYVALINGWENIEPIHDKNFVSPYDPTQTTTDESPYDTYGLSMIFVFVSPSGKLVACNTRWNHNAQYSTEVDNALNRVQISQIIGRRFYDVFKPNSLAIEKINDALERYRNGDDSGVEAMRDLTDSMKAICIQGAWNVLLNGKLLFKEWLDWIGDKQEEGGIPMFSVNREGKYNILLANGKLITRFWFDGIIVVDKEFYHTDMTCYIITCNGKKNMLDDKFELVWKKPRSKWFDDMGPLYNGYMSVAYGINGKKRYNFINLQGEFLWKHPFDEWFIGVGVFQANGLVQVQQNITNSRQFKNNLLNKNGDLVYKEGFDYMYYNTNRKMYSVGIRVKNYIKYNILNTFGKIIWEVPVNEWSENEIDFRDAQTAIVSRGEMSNIINTEGKLISKVWFDNVLCRSDKFDGENIEYFYEVRLNHKSNFLLEDGRYMWDVEDTNHWFDEVQDCIDGFAIVRVGKKYNILCADGFLKYKQPIEKWFDSIEKEYTDDNLYRIKINNKYNWFHVQTQDFIWKHSFNKWFDNVEEIHGKGFTEVKIGDRFNFIYYDKDKANARLVWVRSVDEWFNRVASFYGSAAVVMKYDKRGNKKYNWLSKNGQLLYNDENVDNWFVEVNHGYYDNYAGAKFEGDYVVRYTFNEHGKVLDVRNVGRRNDFS